ncbi:MAG: hypothetical protein HW416_1891 [Chloroflexi bacterium]|nr:hypothetical protein [Chloroflexota bacterium]
MVIYTMAWDLPTHTETLRVYANKARNDWIPTTIAFEGVKEVATYRNPLESTPQVLVVISFEDMAAWQRYVSSRDNERIMREHRTLGCTAITTHVWMPSTLTPEPVRANQTAGATRAE